MGNSLLQATCTLLSALMVVGGSGLVEHPARPRHCPDCAPSWDLPVPLLIARSPAADYVEFDQCMLGQAGRAPPGLLALRQPQIREAIDSLPNCGRCNHGPRHHAPLIGTDPATGAWRTAHKKIYPPDMCRLIARALLSSLSARVAEPVDVEKIYSWHQGDHSHLARALAPVAGRIYSNQNVELSTSHCTPVVLGILRS